MGIESSFDPSGSKDSMVDREIGSCAYRTVRKAADNIDLMVKISKWLDNGGGFIPGGPPGPTGVGISSAAIDTASGNLNLSMTDGKIINVGKVVGRDGQDAADIALRTDLASGSVGKGASLVKFTQEGINASTESVEKTLRRSVWVDQYKLLTDIDDTNCIKRALDTGAAVILLDARTYTISDEIVVKGMQRIIGKGRLRTIINQTNLTKNGLNYLMSFAQGCGAEHFTIKCDVAENAGGSTGVGLKVTNCNDNASFIGIDISNFDTSMQVIGCYQLLLYDFRFRYFRKVGLHLAPYTGEPQTASAGGRYILGKISNLDFAEDNNASIGIWIQQASGEFLNTIDVTTCGKGIVTQPVSTSYVRYLFCSQVLGDSCLQQNWVFNGTAGVTVSNEFEQCWSSNSQGDGVLVYGTNIDGLFWRGGWMRDCRFNGLAIKGGNNIEITAQITRNSAAASNTYDGVVISGASTGTVRLLNSRVGNVLTTVNGSTQRDNIRIDPTYGGSITIQNCNLHDPGNGGWPINNLSLSALTLLNGNLPLRIPGVNTSERKSYYIGSVTAVPNNVTAYIGCNGAQNSFSDSLIALDAPGVVVGLRVKVPFGPGLSQSFEYTIYKNGEPTLIKGSIEGTSTYSLDIASSKNSFQVVEGDSIAIRLTTSAGANTVRHNCQVIIEP